MIELERTFLAKYLPKGLANCKSKEIIDIYIPETRDHPTLRIRKHGGIFEMTKKEPVEGTDSSKQEEQTIVLSEEEFGVLKGVKGKKVHKIRYYYNYNGLVAEFDVFQGELAGLVVVDVEFETEEAKDGFEMPSFCLVDVTQDKFIAGGMLCGKKYADIKAELDKVNYQILNV